jgi:hypothetical protein
MSSSSEEKYFYKLNQKLKEELHQKMEAEKDFEEHHPQCPFCKKQAEIRDHSSGRGVIPVMLCQNCGAVAWQSADMSLINLIKAANEKREK